MALRAADKRQLATRATLLGTGASLVIAALQSILLAPLYIRELGTELYGAWLGSGDILIWLQAFDLGLPNLLIQRVAACDARDDSRGCAEWLATTSAVLVLVALVVVAVGCVVAQYIPAWMGVTYNRAAEFTFCLRSAVICAAVTLTLNSLVGYSRGVQHTTILNKTLILSSVIGFLAAFVGLQQGLGLLSIVISVCARTSVLVMGAVCFWWVSVSPQVKAQLSVRPTLLRELARAMPVTALAGISYSLMNQSGCALLAMFMHPQAAVVLSVTRKSFDLVRSLADAVGTATYGSFAHLVGSSERGMALCAYRRTLALRLLVAVAGAAGCVAVNKALVSVWVGPEQYGGMLLTCILALESIITGHTYVLNSLHRACGPVLQGCCLLIAEAFCRVPLVISLVPVLGVMSPAAVGVVVAGSFGVFTMKATRKVLGQADSNGMRRTVRPWTIRALVLAGSALFAWSACMPDWIWVATVFLAVSAASGGAMLAGDDDLRPTAMPSHMLHS